ncbi:uncharacterized protein LOC131245712 isoform X2 [Magnolia sinica]|uniref:uncharacterized protein LOC131245712 isoform X2 n=1 Tax=Magnolia sinica TaxID=86752 RepID=UPI002657F4A1|nr:uncharacterized protein LOC131245712 isoform X2 [Magnolia sinica]
MPCSILSVLLFIQLVLDSLSFSSATFSILTRSPIVGEKELMLIVENFISEQLNLTKASISEIKKIHSIASEVLKVAHVVLDAAIKLCRAYSQAINLDSFEVTTNENESSMDGRTVDNMSHIISIVTCTTENLYELGTLAATGGGSLVTILNVSWKGVVVLLQLGKGVIADKINIGDIILTLISLATDSLRCAAGAWSSTPREALAVTEAKRTFLPIKFYLVNAVRIFCQYPCQAIKIYKEIALLVLTISTFGISLSREEHLKAASEVLVEFLEPTSFLLLLTLLNSAEVKQESKLQILEWLFTDESLLSSSHPGETVSSITNSTTSLDEIFSVNSESMPRENSLVLGRVVLFLNLLKNSPDLTEEVVLGISMKLGCFLDLLITEEVYSSVLVLHIPVLYGSGPSPELAWNPIFSSALHALKTFMIVAASSQAWGEVESFLVENLLHPHCLCWEIIMELWCFVVRHSETEMLNGIIDSLFSLFKEVASLEPTPFPGCALRKMARSICMLLTYATPSIVDQVYGSIFANDKSHLSSVMYTALLMEGFPLNSFTDSLRKLATQRILMAFCGFIENNGKKLGVDGSLRSGSSGDLILPVHAFSSMLHSLQVSGLDIENQNMARVLKFAVTIIHSYRSAVSSLSKDHLSKLLSQLLEIISNMKHLYACDEIEEVILELRALFVSESLASEVWLHQSKPALASFMAGLCHMEMADGEGNTISSAVWELYHMLLRERHWAFVHLALTSFGYFAARTSCNQLWRFVPQNAALSHDTETGNQVNEERFMSELKAFLEKEAALPGIAPCSKQFSLLVKEGLVLRETVRKFSNINLEVLGSVVVDIDDEIQVKKKRKLPDGINEGMALLQSGLKAMGDGIARWRQQHNDSKELQDEFSTQLSCLEDVILHLLGLADSG